MTIPLPRRTFLARCATAALTALTLLYRRSADAAPLTSTLVTTAPTLVDRLQSYQEDDTPFLEIYDAVYAITHNTAVVMAASTDSVLSGAITTAQQNLAGLRPVGFSLPTSPSSSIAEPILITGVANDPPSNS